MTDAVWVGPAYALTSKRINLTGDYVWKPGTGTRRRLLRQLRLPMSPDEPDP